MAVEMWCCRKCGAFTHFTSTKCWRCGRTRGRFSQEEIEAMWYADGTEETIDEFAERLDSRTVDPRFGGW